MWLSATVSQSVRKKRNRKLKAATASQHQLPTAQRCLEQRERVSSTSFLSSFLNVLLIYWHLLLPPPTHWCGVIAAVEVCFRSLHMFFQYYWNWIRIQTVRMYWWSSSTRRRRRWRLCATSTYKFCMRQLPSRVAAADKSLTSMQFCMSVRA